MRLIPLSILSFSLLACESSPPSDAGLDALTDAPVDAPVDAVFDAADVAPDGPPIDVSRDASADLEPFCDVPGVYTYGPDGGLVAYRESVRIEPGRRFTYSRTGGAVGDDAGARSCTTTLDYCGTSDGGAIDTLGVITALNDPAVIAAFEDAANTLYGRDPRPVDGQVFAIARGDGRHLEIGGDCEGATGCRAIPAGLTRLRTVLTDLMTQQRARPECAGVR